MDRARYTTQLGRAAHSARPGRESWAKKNRATAEMVRERDGHRCQYCGATAKTSGSHLQFDHLTPRSHGGGDEAHNIVLACRRCNSARQNMTLRQWAAYAAVKFGLDFSPRGIRAQARRRLPE
jgi:5-methylcytosine-specific restriction endonuclease McrA